MVTNKVAVSIGVSARAHMARIHDDSCVKQRLALYKAVVHYRGIGFYLPTKDQPDASKEAPYSRNNTRSDHGVKSR